MKRDNLIKMLSDNTKIWDVIVIGGGATGLGIAVDAAVRGLSVVLFEAHDFTKATSSRSTKLVHGGVRYLAQGDVSLVLEALYERGLLLKNAPHITRNQSFLIPNYTMWDNFQYTVGLKMYDWLAMNLGLGSSKYISKKKTIEHIPVLKQEGLKGGVIYHDGQFDDSRLAINLAQSAVEQGACVVNYMEVTALHHNEAGKVDGVTAKDVLQGGEYKVRGQAVINATGVFVDQILQMDQPTGVHLVRPSQGVHLVLDKSFLQSDYAIMIPKTSDGRVLFAVPWHDKVVVGTTDTLMDHALLEPRALDSEIDFILGTAGLYMTKPPTRADVLSVFAGLRPLAAPKKEGSGTKEISRSHKIIPSDSNLITIVGGKWTTYRRMAEDTLKQAEDMQLIPVYPCGTKDFKIHGYKTNPDHSDHMYIYGSDEDLILDMIKNDDSMGQKIHPRYPYTYAEVAWAVREEMATSVEDVLARRVRLLFLDARAAVEAAPIVAEIMAKELGEDESWITAQLNEFNNIAANYILG
ncbi:MAG: FAD-dependent oxidoreductase [Marinifilaceae bacterium]